MDAIAAVDGVDGLFLGPGDLGLRLQHEDTGYDIAEATRRVAAAAKSQGKAWGRPAASAEQLGELHEQGAQLVAYGGEFGAIYQMLSENSKVMDSTYGQ